MYKLMKPFVDRFYCMGFIARALRNNTRKKMQLKITHRFATLEIHKAER